VDHLPKLALDDAARVLVDRRVLGELHDLQRVADRRQRVAQLVGERGEELVLAAVGVAQRLLGDAPLLTRWVTSRTTASRPVRTPA
jgi:hypothetical protein